MIGRYLDALAADGQWCALDRVIEAQDWRTGGWFARGSERCLRGHAEDFDNHEARDKAANEIGKTFYRWQTRGGVGQLFDKLVNRFGMDRVVRAIKQRAGSHTRPNIEIPVTSESAVTHA